MNDKLLAEIQRLRQDIEVQTAINVIEGVNTVETLAALGHFMNTRRPPTPAEAAALERTARARWATQVRQTLALLKSEDTQLDERMTELAALLANPGKRRAPATARAAGSSAPGGRKRKARGAAR